MSDQSKKQLIEEFFHSSLHDHQDDPGAEVWSEISQQMPPKPLLKRIPKSIFLMLALLLLFLLPLGYFISTGDQAEERSTPKTALVKDKTPTKSKLINLPTKDKIILADPSETKAPVAQVENQPKELKPEVAKPSIKKKIDKTAQQKDVLSVQPEQKFLKQPDLKTETFYTKSVEESIREILTDYYKNLNNMAEAGEPLRRVMSPLANRPIPEIHSDYDRIVELPEMDIQAVFPDAEIVNVAPEASKSGSKIYPNFRYGASIEPMTMIHSVAVPDPISIENRITNAGITAGIQLNKNWSILSGLRFRYHDINILGTVDLTYSSENSSVDDQGNQRGDYQIHSLSNSFINVNSNIVNEVQNDGNDIQSGDHFGVDVSGTYRLKYHSIPVWLRYDFGGNRLFFNVRGGIQFHNLVGNKVKDLSATIFDLVSNGATDRLMVENASIQVQTRRDQFIEAGFGIGLNYSLTKAINLGIEPTLYKALTSMFDNRPWSVGVNAGLSIQVDPR